MEDKDDKTLTATTVRELGIEFAGFIKLVNQQFYQLNKTIQDLIKSREYSNDKKADKTDLDALAIIVSSKADLRLVIDNSEDIETLKKLNGLKSTLLWVGLVASAIINIVFVYNLFTGTV